MKRAMVGAVVAVCMAMAGVVSAQTTLPAGMRWARWSAMEKPPVPAQWPRRSVELVYHEAFKQPALRERVQVGMALRLMWDELSAAQKAAGRPNVILEWGWSTWAGSRDEDAAHRTLCLIAPPPAGQEDLDAAVQWLRTKLTGSKLPEDQRWLKVDDALAKLDRVQHFQNIMQELINAQQKVKPELVLKRMAELQAERQKLEMDLLGKKVRGEAIRQQLQQAEREASLKMDQDGILKQLQKVLELRVQDIKRIQDLVKAGVGPQAELRDAEERIAEAQLRMEERKEALRQGTKGELLTRLSNELALLMVDQTELEMRLAVIREQTLPADLTKITEKDLEKVTSEYAMGMEERHPPILLKLEQEEGELSWELLKLVVVEVKEVKGPEEQKGN